MVVKGECGCFSLQQEGQEGSVSNVLSPVVEVVVRILALAIMQGTNGGLPRKYRAIGINADPYVFLYSRVRRHQW